MTAHELDQVAYAGHPVRGQILALWRLLLPMCVFWVGGSLAELVWRSYAPAMAVHQPLWLPAAFLVLVFAVVLVIAAPQGRRRTELRQGLAFLQMPHPVWLLVATVGTVALIVALGWLPYVVPPPPGVDPRAAAVTTSSWWGRVALAMLTAPLYEEPAFRGLLLAVVALLDTHLHHRRLRLALQTAMFVVVTVTFGAIHAEYGMLNVVSCTITGTFYGLLALRTRSLWPGILAHGLHNAFWFLSI